MKINVQKDRQKAKSLLKMAKTTKERLEETDMEKYPTNTVKDYYDIIHELMESLTSLDGKKIKGKGAHRELIEHICKEYSLENSKKHFLQQLRKNRNRIAYEGFTIKENYIRQNREKINKIIETLKAKVEEKIEKS